MDTVEFEAKMMFYIMLKSLDEIAKVDEEFQEDLEGFEAKIQWKISHFKGYQIFEAGNYSFLIDGEIEDPDVTMKIEDADFAKKFFRGEVDGTSAYVSGDLKIEGNLTTTMTYSSFTDYIRDYLEPILPK